MTADHHLKFRKFDYWRKLLFYFEVRNMRHLGQFCTNSVLLGSANSLQDSVFGPVSGHHYSPCLFYLQTPKDLCPVQPHQCIFCLGLLVEVSFITNLVVYRQLRTIEHIEHSSVVIYHVLHLLVTPIINVKMQYLRAVSLLRTVTHQ